MKSALLRTLFVLATVFTMGYTRAAEPLRANATNKITLERDLKRALNKHMVYPIMERRKNMTGVVEVSFVVNKEGRLVILKADSENSDLRDYVMGKLALIKLPENDEGIWRTTHIRFDFHPEKG